MGLRPRTALPPARCSGAASRLSWATIASSLRDFGLARSARGLASPASNQPSSELMPIERREIAAEYAKHAERAPGSVYSAYKLRILPRRVARSSRPAGVSPPPCSVIAQPW